MDYLRYWSLPQKPFAHDASRRFFCGSPQREFIAGLNYLTVHDRRSAVLVSPSGCGATSLLRRVARTNGFGDCAVEMLLTDGDQENRESVLVDLAAALGLSARREDLADRIKATIEATSRQSLRTVWMVDACQTAAAEVAQQLTASVSMLSVVLVADQWTADHLATILAQDPSQGTAMEMELDALSLDDTSDYVRDSLHMAGGSRDCWSDAAIVRLHEISEGRLANMSLAAESALALAARHQMEAVGPEMVEAAHERFARAA